MDDKDLLDIPDFLRRQVSDKELIIEEDTEQILKKHLGANTPSREDVEFDLLYNRLND